MTAHEVRPGKGCFHCLHTFVAAQIPLLGVTEQTAPLGLDKTQAAQRHPVMPVLITDHKRWLLFAPLARYELVHLCFQARVTDGLDNVIGRLDIVTLQGIVSERREKDDRHLTVETAQRTRRPKPIEQTHADVKEDQIERRIVMLDKMHAIAVGGDFERTAALPAVALEELAEMSDERSFIVTDRNM